MSLENLLKNDDVELSEMYSQYKRCLGSLKSNAFNLNKLSERMSKKGLDKKMSRSDKVLLDSVRELCSKINGTGSFEVSPVEKV